jgi:hypothetical protein
MGWTGWMGMHGHPSLPAYPAYPAHPARLATYLASATYATAEIYLLHPSNRQRRRTSRRVPG